MEQIKGSFSSKDGKKISFRPLGSGDAEELLKVINQISKGISDYSKLTNSQMKGLMKARLSIMKRKKGLFLLIECSGKIIGECTLHKTNSKLGVGVIGIGLLKEFRNLGIGKKILRNTINFAGRMNIKQIVAETSSKNKSAIKLYAGIGFKEIKRDKNEITFVRTV